MLSLSWDGRKKTGGEEDSSGEASPQFLKGRDTYTSRIYNATPPLATGSRLIPTHRLCDQAVIRQEVFGFLTSPRRTLSLIVHRQLYYKYDSGTQSRE